MKRALRWVPPLTAAAVMTAACAACGSSSPSASAAGHAATPVLGRPAGDFAHGAGFGKARPARIFNGGDPTGLVTNISWKSWGASRATGTGTSVWAGPGQPVAQGHPAAVTVEAFRLGMCHGKLVYRAVEWYFPGHGQSFSPYRYENICNGSYVQQHHDG